MRVVILGGGLTGLVRALRDARAGHDVTVVERNEIGGLASSRVIDDFVFDTGPHVFHSADPEILKSAKALIGCYRNVPSKPLIYKHGRRFDFVIPTLPAANIERLPMTLRDHALQELDLVEPRFPAENFEDAVASRLGATLYREFYGDYSKKWWGISPRRLAAELAPPDLAVGEHATYGHVSTGFVNLQEEIYPEEGGIGALARALADEAQRHGVRILEHAQVAGLEAEGNMLRRVVLHHAQGIRRLPADRVVSTIPIVELARLLGLACRLRYRSVICIFLKIHQPGPLLDNSRVYFHDPDVMTSRIHEPTYFSPHNAPSGSTSLCAEVTCFEGDDTWNDPTLAERVAQELVQLEWMPADTFEVAGTHRIAHAYPLFEVGYRDELRRIQAHLRDYKTLETIGRSGTFTYLNMDGCFAAGLTNVRSAADEEAHG